LYFRSWIRLACEYFQIHAIYEWACVLILLQHACFKLIIKIVSLCSRLSAAHGHCQSLLLVDNELAPFGKLHFVNPAKLFQKVSCMPEMLKYPPDLEIHAKCHRPMFMSYRVNTETEEKLCNDAENSTYCCHFRTL